MATALDLAPGEGFQFDYTLSGTKSAGDVLVLGDLLAVALQGGSSGERITIKKGGKWRVTKESGAFTQGDELYWDAGNSRLSKTATVGKRFGVAAADAASGDATADAFMDGMGVGVEPCSTTVYGLVKKAAVIGALTDNSGGTGNDTIEACGAAVTGVDGTGDNAASKADVDARLVSIANNFADLAAKVNAVIAGQKTAGQMASS